MSFIIDPYRRFSGPTDPSFSSVVLLSHFDGSSGSTTFVNSAGRGSAIGNGGTSAALSTSQFQYGSASVALNGSSQYVISNSHADYAIGSNDFCIECWVRMSNTTGTQVVCDMRPIGTNGLYPDLIVDSGVPTYFVNSAVRISGGTVSANTWTALAVARVSGTTRLFKDGVQVGSDYTDANVYLQSSVKIGASSFSSAFLNGFIDEFRFTNGAGRYTTTYTPSGPFPDQ